MQIHPMIHRLGNLVREGWKVFGDAQRLVAAVGMGAWRRFDTPMGDLFVATPLYDPTTKETVAIVEARDTEVPLHEHPQGEVLAFVAGDGLIHSYDETGVHVRTVCSGEFLDSQPGTKHRLVITGSVVMVYHAPGGIRFIK